MSTLNEIEKRDRIIDLVCQAIESAGYKYGGFKSSHEGYALIKEELDGLWEDIKNEDGKSFNANHRAIHVAAMAIKYVMSYGTV